MTNILVKRHKCSIGDRGENQEVAGQKYTKTYFIAKFIYQIVRLFQQK